MVNRPLSSRQKIQFLPDLFYCDVRTLIHTVLDIFFVLRCQEPVFGLAACFPPLFRQPVRRPFAHRICGYRAPLLPAPFAYPLPALPARFHSPAPLRQIAVMIYTLQPPFHPVFPQKNLSRYKQRHVLIREYMALYWTLLYFLTPLCLTQDVRRGYAYTDGRRPAPAAPRSRPGSR